MKLTQSAISNRSNKSNQIKKSNQTKIQIKNKTPTQLPSDFTIIVTIKDWNTRIFCGNPTQTVSWLINYSLFLYDSQFLLKSGVVYGFLIERTDENEENTQFFHFNEKRLSLIHSIFHKYDRIVLLFKNEYMKKVEDLKKISKMSKSSRKNMNESRFINTNRLR